MMVRFVCMLVLGWICFWTTGCGPKSKGLPVAYVEGIVKLDSEPLGGATVVFTPVKSGDGETARGKTDATGKYTLTSLNGDENKGALPAEYYVMIWKSETRAVDPPRYDKAADAYISHEAVDVVPAVYAEPDKTPFRFTVESGKTNSFPLELSTTAQAKGGKAAKR